MICYDIADSFTRSVNKPGLAQVGAISKAQKYQNDFQVSIYSTLKSKKQKNGPSGTPGPASTSPCRAKGGRLPKLSTILSQLNGGPFGEKTNFRKKVSQCRKNRKRRDPSRFFNIHSVAKHEKIEEKNFISGKKFHNAEKN